MMNPYFQRLRYCSILGGVLCLLGCASVTEHKIASLSKKSSASGRAAEHSPKPSTSTKSESSESLFANDDAVELTRQTIAPSEDDLQQNWPQVEAPSKQALNTPDAIPKAEPVTKKGKPYFAMGKTFVPNKKVVAYREEGVASWYGKQFHGRKTANGETYNMMAMSAAHRTLALPSYVRVTNTLNNKSVVVRVNDRGPFHSKRIIDLSYAAAERLDLVKRGQGKVLIEAIVPGSNKLVEAEINDQQKADQQLAQNTAPANQAVARKADTTKSSVKDTVVADARTPVADRQIGLNSNRSANLASASDSIPAAKASNPASLVAASSLAPNSADDLVITSSIVGFFRQFAAFTNKQNASKFLYSLKEKYPTLPLLIRAEQNLFRVVSGPYHQREEALAEQVSDNNVVVYLQ